MTDETQSEPSITIDNLTDIGGEFSVGSLDVSLRDIAFAVGNQRLTDEAGAPIAGYGVIDLGFTYEHWGTNRMHLPAKVLSDGYSSKSCQPNDSDKLVYIRSGDDEHIRAYFVANNTEQGSEPRFFGLLGSRRTTEYSCTLFELSDDGITLESEASLSAAQPYGEPLVKLLNSRVSKTNEPQA